MELDMIPVVADVEPVDTEVTVVAAMAPVDTEEESEAFERADLENVDLSEVNMDEKPADLGMSADADETPVGAEEVPADAVEIPAGAVIWQVPAVVDGAPAVVDGGPAGAVIRQTVVCARTSKVLPSDRDESAPSIKT